MRTRSSSTARRAFSCRSRCSSAVCVASWLLALSESPDGQPEQQRKRDQDGEVVREQHPLGERKILEDGLVEEELAHDLRDQGAGDDGEGDPGSAAGTPVNRGAVERQPARPDNDVLLFFGDRQPDPSEGERGDDSRRRRQWEAPAKRQREHHGREDEDRIGAALGSKLGSWRCNSYQAYSERSEAAKSVSAKAASAAVGCWRSHAATRFASRAAAATLDLVRTPLKPIPDGSPAGGRPASLSRPILPLPNDIAIGDRELPHRRGRNRPAADAERVPRQHSGSRPHVRRRHTDDCNLDSRTVEALRRDQRGRRADVQRAQGHHHRLPGAEWCRQDDDAPDAARAWRPPPPGPRPSTASATQSFPTPSGTSGRCWRRPASIRAARRAITFAS